MRKNVMYKKSEHHTDLTNSHFWTVKEHLDIYIKYTSFSVGMIYNDL